MTRELETVHLGAPFSAARRNSLELNLSDEEKEFVADAAKLYQTVYVESLDNVFKIGRALEIISKRYRNSGVQGGYSDALVQCGFTSRDGRAMHKAIRSAHKTLLDNEQQVRAWWSTVSEKEKRDWLSAKAIYKHWKRSQADPDRQRNSSTNAALREQLLEANEQIRRFREADGGSLFDPDVSSPEEIARAFRERWRTTPSKLKRLSHALQVEDDDLQEQTRRARPATRNARRGRR